MGKPTGFLEFERVKETYAPVAERVKHYGEFVPTLTVEEAKQQGDAHRQQGGQRVGHIRRPRRPIPRPAHP